MPRHRNPPAAVWLKNWRYPPPPPSSNISTLVGYKVVAVKTIFPPYDTGEEEVDDTPLESFGSLADVKPVSDQRNVAAFVSSATTVVLMGTPGTNVDVVGPTSTLSVSSSDMVTDELLTLLGANLPYSIVLLFATVLLISTSLLTMYIISTSDALKNVIGHYLISLAATDFLTGVLITPMALYASFSDGHRYRYDRTLCKAEAYLEVTLYSTHVYIFMWIGVDRYAALIRPSRYEIEQTLTRCKCWILITWITAALLCSPILFDEMHARYYQQAFLCVLDWGRMAPYTVTLAILVLAPSFITVAYSYTYIMRKIYNAEDLDENQRGLLETDSSYVMTFFVVLFHFVSWAPWFGLKAYEWFILRHELTSKPLHFSLLWLAIGGANWKIFIYTSLNAEFRCRLRHVFRTIFRCHCIRARGGGDDSDGYVSSFAFANNRSNWEDKI